ncbi:MAG: 2-dehydropantoate 2-reductase [Bacteroidetes bacterium]|nr:2-dehydropantoate 2-reductase [Bacteroidota bacterium]
MNNKTKILIVGIGGVGGYIGGLLAKQYQEDDLIDIYFLARGKHLEEIQKNGLKVIQGESTFISHPKLATDNPSDIGPVDYILLCTKSYDLESTLEQLKPCIVDSSMILPLLNGVDSSNRIKKVFPFTKILDGCIYIVSRLKEPRVIEMSGNICKLYFGNENLEKHRLTELEVLLNNASIDATSSHDIQKIIWEKFIFISATASATSYFDHTIGQLLSDADELQVVQKLIEEVITVAKASNIELPLDIHEKTLNKLKVLPFETTSSMHSDFKNHKSSTELESLTGFVVREGERLHINTPIFDRIFNHLKTKI